MLRRSNVAVVLLLIASLSVAGAEAGGRAERVAVPPGPNSVVQLALEGTPPYENFRLTMTGPSNLQVGCVRAIDTALDICFANASPREVTTYFAQNPITMPGSNLYVYVSNPTPDAAHLTLAGHWT